MVRVRARAYIYFVMTFLISHEKAFLSIRIYRADSDVLLLSHIPQRTPTQGSNMRILLADSRDKRSAGIPFSA